MKDSVNQALDDIKERVVGLVTDINERDKEIAKQAKKIETLEDTVNFIAYFEEEDGFRNSEDVLSEIFNKIRKMR